MDTIIDKKICHFTSVHRYNDIRIFSKECSSLAQVGYTIYLIAPNCNTKKINRVSIIGVQTNSKSRISRIFNTSWKVYRSAYKTNADIFHFHDPEMIPAGLFLKLKGKKVIYDVHEDVPRQILSKHWIKPYLRKIVSKLFERFENFAAAKFDYIITATPYIRNRFLRINSNTIDINNYPLSNEIFKKVEWETKKNEVCYVGGISSERGINELIDSMEFVNNNIILNIVGEFSPKSLKQQIICKRGWSKVNDYGYIERESITKILALSKAGIVTFTPVPNHINAQPNKIFEYMSAGIPVIASNFPLWKEIIEGNNCGLCVDPMRPKEIADAINIITSNQQKAQEMGSNGKEAVIEKYNWEKEEKKLISIYNKLLFTFN